MRLVPSPTPKTAGMPYSRATMEPCARMLPTSVTKPTQLAKSWVHAGVVSGLTRILPGVILSNSEGPKITLALAVTVPELTAKPRMMSLDSSFLICVSLNETASIEATSAGNVPGG